MKYVVVAGGAGFIGSHVVRRMLEEGFFVISIDNLLTGSESNIRELEEHDNFKFISADVSAGLGEVLSSYSQIDYIFHLASPASPNKNSEKSYLSFPVETLLVNSTGTHELLKIAKDRQARFIFASTSEVYGDPAVSPQKESYWGNVNPNGIRSVYDEAKRFGEALVMAYQRKYGVDVRIARIFNTYGPRMRADDGRVVSNFIVQALRSEDITIYGDGSQTRSFCYISDLVDGLVALMMREGLSGEVVNLGNPHEYTIREIADKIVELTNSSSEVVFEPLPEDDPRQRRPDIAKARELLGFSPKIELEEGFQKTIEYFRSIL